MSQVWWSAVVNNTWLWFSPRTNTNSIVLAHTKGWILSVMVLWNGAWETSVWISALHVPHLHMCHVLAARRSTALQQKNWNGDSSLPISPLWWGYFTCLLSNTPRRSRELQTWRFKKTFFRMRQWRMLDQQNGSLQCRSTWFRGLSNLVVPGCTSEMWSEFYTVYKITRRVKVILPFGVQGPEPHSRTSIRLARSFFVVSNN